MKRKVNKPIPAKRSKLSKPKQKAKAPKPRKEQVKETVVDHDDIDDTDSEDFATKLITKKPSTQVAEFDAVIETRRYETFHKALNMFYSSTYGTPKDRQIVSNASAVTGELIQAEIPLKAFMHMVYTNNAKFPPKLFEPYELAKVGVFVNFTMNGPFPTIAPPDDDCRDNWHTTPVSKPWTFRVTPSYTRKVVGLVRNTDKLPDFKKQTLSDHSKIPVTFFTYGTGTYFLGIWDMKLLERRCEEFDKKGTTRKFNAEFRKVINQDCEKIMFDETGELKKEFSTDTDTAILVSAFGGWWAKRHKARKEEEKGAEPITDDTL